MTVWTYYHEIQGVLHTILPTELIHIIHEHYTHGTRKFHDALSAIILDDVKLINMTLDKQIIKQHFLSILHLVGAFSAEPLRGSIVQSVSNVLHVEISQIRNHLAKLPKPISRQQLEQESKDKTPQALASLVIKLIDNYQFSAILDLSSRCPKINVYIMIYMIEAFKRGNSRISSRFLFLLVLLSKAEILEVYPQLSDHQQKQLNLLADDFVGVNGIPEIYGELYRDTLDISCGFKPGYCMYRDTCGNCEQRVTRLDAFCWHHTNRNIMYDSDGFLRQPVMYFRDRRYDHCHQIDIVGKYGRNLEFLPQKIPGFFICKQYPAIVCWRTWNYQLVAIGKIVNDYFEKLTIADQKFVWLVMGVQYYDFDGYLDIG
jgi:hypothetical protein